MTSSEPLQIISPESFTHPLPEYFTHPLDYIFKHARVGPLDSFTPLMNEEPPRTSGEMIEHEHLDLLGHTTNILVFSYFDKNRSTEFTREDVRMAIDSHKRALKGYLSDKEISRIQSGKAAVDYWIDRLVENEEIIKKNSNPVRFWRPSTIDKSKKEVLKPLLSSVTIDETNILFNPVNQQRSA